MGRRPCGTVCTASAADRARTVHVQYKPTTFSFALSAPTSPALPSPLSPSLSASRVLYSNLRNPFVLELALSGPKGKGPSIATKAVQSQR